MDAELKGKFEELVSPLDTMIALVFKRRLQPDLPKLIGRYRELVLRHEGAVKDLDDLIKTSVHECISMLSKKYLKQLKEIYSDDGIIFYTYSQLRLLAISRLQTSDVE